jgi:uncharacterized membrane protein YhiD involved in acid resistance
MGTSLLALISSLLTLVILIVKEYFARLSAAAQAQKQYQLTTEEFDAIVSSSMTRIRFQVRQDSDQAKTVEDQVDQSANQRKDQP